MVILDSSRCVLPHSALRGVVLAGVARCGVRCGVECGGGCCGGSVESDADRCEGCGVQCVVEFGVAAY